MLLYNVTIKIAKEVETEWLQWMKSSHVPDVIHTGQFAGSRISRLMDQPDEEDPTYVIQYECESIETFNYYIDTYAAALREEFAQRYKDKFVAFRTLMEVVG
ncbi:MAG: DUF4286 family protein [Chitinophagales bacterium]|nr:DUF4286 family protein [Chitinophagales bacterium]